MQFHPPSFFSDGPITLSKKPIVLFVFVQFLEPTQMENRMNETWIGMTNPKWIGNQKKNERRIRLSASLLYWQFPKIVHILSIHIKSKKYHSGWASMPPSSSGSGHLSFKEATGIRLPLGVGYYEKKWVRNYQYTQNGFFRGRCPSG